MHLRTCLKGRAIVDIQHLSLTEENYDVAIALLDKEYADPELTKYKILSFIAKCNLTFLTDLGNRCYRVLSN